MIVTTRWKAFGQLDEAKIEGVENDISNRFSCGCQAPAKTESPISS
jgi:hypothetical protein